MEITEKTANTEIELPKYDKMAAYEFGLTPEGDTITLEDLKKMPHEEGTIYRFSGGKIMDEINDRIGNKFAADADQRDWVVRMNQAAEEKAKAYSQKRYAMSEV